MLYITHDIAAAGKVSDRITVMLDGRIIEEGPSNEIYVVLG
jgi:peptide/nickel transport system ATP-binding protein